MSEEEIFLTKMDKFSPLAMLFVRIEYVPILFLLKIYKSGSYMRQRMNRHSQTWRNKLLVYLEYWIMRILPPLFDNIWEIWDCSYTCYKHKVIIHNTLKSEANKK